MPLTRRQFLTVAGGVGAGTLAGCAGAGAPVVDTGTALEGTYSGPPVTISYWNGFTGGDGPAMRQLVADFNASQDLITVDQNTVNWAQYYQRVVAAVHAGKGPDIGAMHLEQLATQAARQTINPLDEVLDELELDGADYPDRVWEAGQYNGVRYGVPLDVHSLASYSNQELMRQAGVRQHPETGEELMQALQAMVDAGIENPFWMPNRWPAHLMFLTLIWQFGGEPYAADGSRALFAEEPGVKALNWMRSLSEKGFSPGNVAQDTQYTAFKNGEGAFTWDGIWQINDLEATAADLDWGIAPVPTIGTQPAVWANSHHLVLFRQRQPDDNKLEASKAFIRYLTQQSAVWSNAGMIPARNDARETPEFRQSPQSALSPIIDDMRFLPTVPGVPDVQVQTLEIAVSEAILGRQAPKAALEEAAARADQLLQANLRKFER